MSPFMSGLLAGYGLGVLTMTILVCIGRLVSYLSGD